jgi:hypothetical protein
MHGNAPKFLPGGYFLDIPNPVCFYPADYCQAVFDVFMRQFSE